MVLRVEVPLRREEANSSRTRVMHALARYGDTRQDALRPDLGLVLRVSVTDSPVGSTGRETASGQQAVTGWGASCLAAAGVRTGTAYGPSLMKATRGTAPFHRGLFTA